MTEILERRSAITGLGQSAIGRNLERTNLDLTLEAVLAAIEDAGLARADIDGLATFPGGALNARDAGRYASAGVRDVQDALRLELGWSHGGAEGPAPLGAVVAACLAIASGLARHVVVWRTVTESSQQGSGSRAEVAHAAGLGNARVDGYRQWSIPFGAGSSANLLALYTQAHFDRYGTTREQLAQIALTDRANAADNPRAVFREPLSLDEYLGARMISTPLCLFDCDLPVDGATAVVVSHVDAAPDARRPAAHVHAVGTAMRGRPSWDQFDDLTTMAARDAAAHLWSRSDLTTADVDLAQLYDGFSFLALAWLEALGFCEPGTGGEFVEGGKRIARDGDVPLNTCGGQLSAGRLHGFGLLHEACLQLRGDSGDRQLDAPQTAVVANGGGPVAGCMLLTRGTP
ncbi:MAG: thiolase family protein [Acidimicrobiia bacterium]